MSSPQHYENEPWGEPTTPPQGPQPPSYQPAPQPPSYQPAPHDPSTGSGPYGPYRQAPPGRIRRSGLAGWVTTAVVALLAVVKYGVILLKIPFLATLVSLLVSFGLYTLAAGPVAAGGIVVMIFIHEMGHVVEIRRQGMQATAPIFIPFMGAAIFQRSHPTDALHQAEIGIAGPIAGTMASIAALVLYVSTGWHFLLAWAWWGFLVNLFNLIPFGMLDGGWILAAASKWFQVAGLVLLAVAVIWFHLIFSPVLILLLLFGIPAMIDRFRNDRLPYYQSVPVGARFIMGFAWLGLVAILGYGLMQAAYLLGPVA